ncbi:MAG: nucleoside phosphorylase [Actinomycetia bacterium]|nr:nucleoside phosphorylase [Actinomycetes bacterium]
MPLDLGQNPGMVETGAQRVGILTPMVSELAPFQERIELVEDGPFHRGKVGGTEVVVMLTTMGMGPAADAAAQIIETGVEHVIMVGVAGGIDAETVSIGQLITPEAVIDRLTGESFRPAPTPGVTPQGKIECGDELITDAPRLAMLTADGVIALDMETAAVARVCEAAGVPWSVFRGISDFAGDPLIDAAFFAMAKPDGTMDPADLTAYLEADPTRLPRLMELAAGAGTAAANAAMAAIDAIKAANPE